MSEKPRLTVIVPDPTYRVTPSQDHFFFMAQALMTTAIDSVGPDMGASLVLSGITRGLRRHMSIEDIQSALRGLADTLPEVAQHDRPD